MKILIIDKMHDSIKPLLEGINCRVHYEPEISPKKVSELIKDFDGLIVRSKLPIDATFLENASHLKFVARAGAGIDNVDMAAMQKYNIKLINAPEGNRDAVAEHTIGLMLTVLNKIVEADKQIRVNIWNREANRGVELGNKTVGLLGYGYMGKAVAKRLKAFGCNVLVYDIKQFDINEAGINQVEFDKFAKETEILSIHIPLSAENRSLIDKHYLSKFSNLSYLINTSRGEVIQQDDLVALLSTNKIKGAGLDVLANEKLGALSSTEEENFNQLKSLNNVVLTPHVAGWTAESYLKINEVLTKKIKQLN